MTRVPKVTRVPRVRKKVGVNRVKSKLNIESTPISQVTPKSPKGDFCKFLIFSFFPLGLRVKQAKNQNKLPFRSGLNIHD